MPKKIDLAGTFTSLESRKFQSLPWQAAAALKVFDIFGYFLCLSQFSGATDCALKPGVCPNPSDIFSCFREDENQLGFWWILGSFRQTYRADGCHMSQVPRNLLKIWGFRCFNGLVLGKIYRKTPYLMGKSMVSCRFSLKPIHWLLEPKPPGLRGPPIAAENQVLSSLLLALLDFRRMAGPSDERPHFLGSFRGTG